MDKLFNVEWAEMFIPSVSIAEMIVRGTIMYAALFLVFRFVMKRQAGALGIADIVVIVIIADAAQNAFAGEYRSITEGIVLVLTIVFWDFVIDWLGYRFRALEKILEPEPLPLVENGRMVRRNMRREMVTHDELMGFLRKQGLEDIEEVKSARLERDGEISIVKKKGSGGRAKAAQKSPARDQA